MGGTIQDTVRDTSVITDVTVVHEPATASSPVRLFLLGGFELEIDGMPVETQPAVERLIALVALSPRGIARHFAAFQLWPDKLEARARANLRSALWRLQKVSEGVLVASSTRLRINPSIWMDIRDGLDAPERHPSGVPQPFQTLLPDLLPDWYDDWLTVERERFRQLRLHHLERRARQALDDGETADAIQLGLAAIAIEGTRESSHQIIVDAHLAEGNEWEAERERLRYEHCLAAGF